MFMRPFSPSPIQLQLLNLLAPGHCQSGNALGQQLGISRAAVWKQIRQLTELGLPIKSIAKRGYQLSSPMFLLDESIIRQVLSRRGFNQSIHFHLYGSLGSTNQFLKEVESNTPLTICCAEMQTQGRGRFGRQWISPFGENIYFSSRWELNCCLSQLSGLSLVVGLAILASLKDSQIDESIQLKWPNDLLWENKKLGGILIEVIAESNGHAQVIIGIGLNVNTATHLSPQPEKPWCSLYEITGKLQDRNSLVAHLIYQLNLYMKQFLQTGFAAFMRDWRCVDYLYNKFITVTKPTGTVHGKALGINEQGQLCLKDEEGQVHHLSCGDTSVKAF
jgi:BirA family biotin operon repressor/biotin-[acetyl-CoA-carboxylase] ligase